MQQNTNETNYHHYTTYNSNAYIGLHIYNLYAYIYADVYIHLYMYLARMYVYIHRQVNDLMKIYSWYAYLRTHSIFFGEKQFYSNRWQYINK